MIDQVKINRIMNLEWEDHWVAGQLCIQTKVNETNEQNRIFYFLIYLYIYTIKTKINKHWHRYETMSFLYC